MNTKHRDTKKQSYFFLTIFFLCFYINAFLFL